MKQAKQITLDGKTYTVNPFTADYGYDLFEEFIVLFGPALVKLLGAAKGFDKSKPLMEQDLNIESIGDGFMELMVGFKGKPGTLREFMKKVLQNTMVGQTSQSVVLDFETRFMGEYLHGIKLTAKSFVEQYRDFLDGFGGLAKVLAVKVQ